MASVVLQRLRTILSVRPATALSWRTTLTPCSSLPLSRSRLPQFRLYSDSTFRPEFPPSPAQPVQSQFRAIDPDLQPQLQSPKRTVYIGNLPWHVSEKELKRQLMDEGLPDTIDFSYDTYGRFRGHGYATFPTVEEATRFVEAAQASPLMFGGRQANIHYSARETKPARGLSEPSNTLFVANLPFGVDETDLREFFGTYGNIVRVALAYGADGNARGFAHVEFDSTEAPKAIIGSQPVSMFQRLLRLDYAPPRTRTQNPPHHTLYFSDYVGDDLDLRRAMKDLASKIIGIHYMRDKATNERSGTGFINFQSIDDATRALELFNGSSTPGGNVLKLAFARKH